MASFRLFLRYFQAFFSPNSLYSLVIDDPALIAQQSCHAPIAIASILVGQFDNTLSKQFFIACIPFMIPLCPSGLSDHPTGIPFRNIQRFNHLLNGLAFPAG